MDNDARSRPDAPLEEQKRVEFDARDKWTLPVRLDLMKMTPEARAAWDDLFRLGWKNNSASTPSKTFLRSAARIVDRIGVTELRERTLAWFAEVQLPPRHPGDRSVDGSVDYLPGDEMKDKNALYLRALVWVWSERGDADVARAIADLAIVCLTKMAEIGAYSNKLGNACIYTLGAMPAKDAVAELARLKANVKYRVALRLIEQAYQKAVSSSKHGPGDA